MSNNPFFSIVTPSIQRESLARCCSSVDSQDTEWEQIVMVDSQPANYELLDRISHAGRRVFHCPSPHHNYGNTCRHEAWQYATGDYILHLDDDNLLADQHVLRDIATAIEDAGFPEIAVFPIERHGQWFYSVPPRLCHTDTANLVVKREIARWPDIPDYTADGIWAERLVVDHGYTGFQYFRPIVVMPFSSEGK